MLKNIIILTTIAITYVGLVSYVHLRKHTNSAVKTIIIDPGHGGKDPGASCYEHSCTEAEITLAISLQLVKVLETLLPNSIIYLTRKNDSYPSLQYRAELANEKKGDLFVSIHCNSASSITEKKYMGEKSITYYEGKGRKKKKLTKQVPLYKYVSVPNPANGMETFVYIPDKTEQKTDAIAARENAEIYNDPNYKEKYGEGMDISSTEFIAKSKLKTKRYFLRSNLLATLIQEEGATAGRNNRNVKQRGVGIWVLQATAMPAVLVETGYISNPTEAAYLNSTKGQAQMAQIIAKAIKKYSDDLSNPIAVNNINAFTQNNYLAKVFFTKPKSIKV